MKKFNTSDIFTGYLKQLLKTFNLPKLKVYTKEHEEFFKKENEERSDILNTITEAVNDEGKKYFPNDTHYVPYIKDGKIQEYINGQWDVINERQTKAGPIKYYNYGDKILNYTKNLVIRNNIYDSYTHEYLGDYLRFQRDYNGLNLMSLYNCFSNRACDNLKIKDSLSVSMPESGDITKVDIDFNTSDINYKIYMLPVKLFQEYTIAIDCESPIELCCGIYGEYQDTREKFNQLTKLTYQKINYSKFSQPFLFTKLSLDTLEKWDNTLTTLKKEIIKNETDLKLFIKIPKDNSSTIVVLEGNYINWNDNLLMAPKKRIFDIAPYTDNQTITEADNNKFYLIKSQDTNTYSLYRAAYVKIKKENEEGEKVEEWEWGLINLGSNLSYLLGVGNFNYLLYNDEIDNSKFRFIEDTTTASTDDIEAAFNNYRMRYNVSEPYIAYYLTANNELLVCATSWNKTSNYTAINFDATSKGITEQDDLPLISALQLLQFNTEEQHPFADRLIEYLTGNAIVGTAEEISANILRAQKALTENLYYTPKFAGFWDSKMNKLFYNYMVRHQNTMGVNRDILGYVDKDVEKYYSYTDQYTLQTISLLNTELTEEDR